MRRLLVLSAIAVALAAAPVRADDAAGDDQMEILASLTPEDLAQKRGGTETAAAPTNVVQDNSSRIEATNENARITNSGRMITGDIRMTDVSNNRGLTTVMQNTGSLVNMSHSTNLNVYLH